MAAAGTAAGSMAAAGGGAAASLSVGVHMRSSVSNGHCPSRLSRRPRLRRRR